MQIDEQTKLYFPSGHLPSIYSRIRKTIRCGCSASKRFKEYKTEFKKGIRNFVVRVKRRTQEKMQKAIANQEEGGLDHAEVFEELLEFLNKML